MTTTTCDGTEAGGCFPNYYGVTGTFHLDLTCSVNSPAYYFAALFVNGVSTPTHEMCCRNGSSISCSTPPPAVSLVCDGSTLSATDQAKLYTPCPSTAANSCGQTIPGTYVCDASTGQLACLTSTPPEYLCPPLNCSGYWSDVSGSCSNTTCGSGTLQQTYTKTQNGSNGGDTSCPATGTTRSGNTLCDAACTPPPAPTISGPYQNGPSIINPAYAYDPLGYQVFAQATSPYATNPAVDSHLTYYFEYGHSTNGGQTITWDTGGWASQKK